MSKLRPDDFDAFFRAVHGYSPFRWQSMLAHRVVEVGWPEGIDLPTASGKTACLDVATFALAMTARPAALHGRSPRRIFFVVDRRVVVDAAYERAQKLEAALRDSTDPVVLRVASALRSICASESPLISCRIRGGAARDLRWRLDPTQPAIIAATVDQVGSRLLFSGYGTTDRTAPIDAGLTACDSLILLDEAHCAVPFLETARAVRLYSGPGWVEESIVPPLQVSLLSATIPEDVEDVFPRPAERQEALSGTELRRRIEAPKRAHIGVAKIPDDRAWTLGKKRSRDDLVLAAAQSAADFVVAGHRRIAVMVNRVRTAARISEQLDAGLDPEAAKVVLITGRMRPVDRDRLVHDWLEVLRSRPATEVPEVRRAVIVVTTQCLEVGADFSFDAVVTECAAFDALRQRFGRLDRLGDVYMSRPDAIPARVLIRPEDRKMPTPKQLREGDVDPVYGAALPVTWKWLSDRAQRSVFDFGISAVDAALAGSAEERESLHAPAPRAPVMLPAHLDLWVQTGPRPAVLPDPALFLHGPGRGRQEARIAFRVDLPIEDDLELWRDTVALLPPTGAELLSVPLGVVKRWLRGESIAATDLSDVEGEAEIEESLRPTADPAASIPFLVWKGRDRTKAHALTNAIRPDEVLMVRADRELVSRLAHYFQRAAGVPYDVAEEAYLNGRRQHVLRLHPGVIGGWREHPPVARLLDWSLDETPAVAELPDLFEDLVRYSETDGGALPRWLIEAAQNYRALARAGRVSRYWKLRPYPGLGSRGWILLGRPGAAVPEDEGFDDEDDTLSESAQITPLADHCQAVSGKAGRFAALCLGETFEDTFTEAGVLHDAGKADERFQAFLQGSEFAVANGSEPLAKGPSVPWQKRHRDRLRLAIGLPDQFRHEAVSLQLAERADSAGEMSDLVLHLIASHHGHARPFFPVCNDEDPPSISAALGNGGSLHLSAADRVSLIPPHYPNSGVADRFWGLVRRFGWWGSAYLESLLRLADWEASRRHGADEQQEGSAA